MLHWLHNVAETFIVEYQDLIARVDVRLLGDLFLDLGVAVVRTHEHVQHGSCAHVEHMHQGACADVSCLIEELREGPHDFNVTLHEASQ